MKGAKGGRRDRIISFLFSKKNQEKKNELEIETKEQTEIKEENIDIIKEQLILDNQKNKTPYQNTTKDIKATQNNDTINIENTSSIETREVIDLNNLIEKKEFIDDERYQNEKEEFIDDETYQNEKEENDKHIETQEGKNNEIIVESSEEQIQIQTHNTIEELNNIEISEPKNVIQFAVFEELEKMIKEDYYEIQEIKYELDILTQKEKDEVLTDEIEKLQRELEVLIKRFEEIKNRYEYIYSTKDFDSVNDLQDNYISGIVSEYKDSVKSNTEIENFVNEIKYIEEYINIINIIIDVEKNKDSIKDDIDEKLEKYEIRDIEFEELKERFTDVEKVNSLLDSFNKKQDSIIKDLENKVQETINIKNEITRTTKLVPNFNKLFQAALMIAVSKKIPPTPAGNILKASILINSVMLASSFIEQKENIKQTKTITYTNYEKDINKSINSVNSTILNIDNTLLDLKDIKETFKQSFSEFQGQIPEYEEMMKNIEDIEKELVSKQSIILKYNDDFNKILDDNNVKVKKIEDNM